MLKKEIKIGSKVLVDGKKGTLVWKDRLWFKDGEPADVLVKVKFDDDTPLLRYSQLILDTEMAQTINETIDKSKPLIDFSEFLKIESSLEIKVGYIIDVEEVPKSEKLLKLTVNFGDCTKIVVTNIKQSVKTYDLIEQCFAFVTNLKPSKMMGIVSEAMIIPGDLEKGNLAYMSDVAPGTKLL